MRVRWRSAGRVAAVAAVGLSALQVLPGLLKPPQAPPLAADVGLPRPVPAREPAVEIREPEPDPRRAAPPRRAHGRSPATAVIGTTPRRRHPKRTPDRGRVDLPSHREKKSTERPDPAPAAPEPPPYVPAPQPPPAPEFVPVPAPEPAPPPTDGSVEFAPH